MHRSMKVSVRRVAGRWLAMYETQIRDEFGNLKFRILVDIASEVTWC